MGKATTKAEGGRRKPEALPPCPAEQVETAEITVPLGEITVPLGEIPEETYISRHVEVRLTQAQAISLRRMFEGLDAKSERLANDRRVASSADVVRWLLEAVNGQQ